jgi:hypothetical protein
MNLEKTAAGLYEYMRVLPCKLNRCSPESFAISSGDIQLTMLGDAGGLRASARGSRRVGCGGRRRRGQGRLLRGSRQRWRGRGKGGGDGVQLALERSGISMKWPEFEAFLLFRSHASARLRIEKRKKRRDLFGLGGGCLIRVQPVTDAEFTCVRVSHHRSIPTFQACKVVPVRRS